LILFTRGDGEGLEELFGARGGVALKEFGFGAAFRGVGAGFRISQFEVEFS